MERISSLKIFPKRKKAVFYHGKGYSYLKKVDVSKKYAKTPLYLWYGKRTEFQQLTRKIQSNEKGNRKHTDQNKAQLKAESDNRSGKKRLCSESQHVIRKKDDAEDSLNTLSPPVKRLRNSELEKKISEADQPFTSFSNDGHLQTDQPTEIITKRLNPMLNVANCEIRRHNELMNRFCKCFDQCFKADEEYSEDLEKDYLFPEELLSKPDLDFEKLQELPFNFRTSLVTVRSLVQKTHLCRQKCDRQLDVILNVMLNEIQAKSLGDKDSSCTPYYQDLLKELKHMSLLLKRFSRYADCCNAHLEKILKDVEPIGKDLV